MNLTLLFFYVLMIQNYYIWEKVIHVTYGFDCVINLCLLITNGQSRYESKVKKGKTTYLCSNDLGSLAYYAI
ncbi:hypothetical protein L1887_32773 [Cichorium endivia]|nr:hypothetical protein L1887_32773 [Cichorium endivia]